MREKRDLVWRSTGKVRDEPVYVLPEAERIPDFEGRDGIKLSKSVPFDSSLFLPKFTIISA